MSIAYTEDAGLRQTQNAVRFKVHEHPLLTYSNWRRSGGHFWAAPEAIDFLNRLVQAWRSEALAAAPEYYAVADVPLLAKVHTPPPLFLGDISQKGGGTWKDHKSHAEGTQIDIYYITRDRTNTRIFPTRGGMPDKDWNFDTEMNVRLLRAILKCRPYRVLTEVPSILKHPEFAANPRIVSKPPHWDHFHVDVVRQSYQRGDALSDQRPYPGATPRPAGSGLPLQGPV